MGMKEYVRPNDGYRIRVSEKAYRLFYQKQGFVPAELRTGSRTAMSEQQKDADTGHDTGVATEKDKDADTGEQDTDSKTAWAPDAGAQAQPETAPRKKRTKKAPAVEQ